MLFYVKWLLIRHCIESKNPREDQYSINHGFGFGVGLRGHSLNELTIAQINSNYIPQAGDNQCPALTRLHIQPNDQQEVPQLLMGVALYRSGLVLRDAWGPLLHVLIPDETDRLTVAFNSDFMFDQFICSHNFLMHSSVRYLFQHLF